MDIQWFPGHMQETEQFLTGAMSQVDVVMEILDARLPLSSANPLLDKLSRNCVKVKILNKQDLADPQKTAAWLDYFKNQISTPALAVSGTDRSDTWRAMDLCTSRVKKKRNRRIRVMVAGIPNSGKSTIINSLAGKKIAKTGNVPAITRHQQRTSLKNRIDIYDTPGILMPILSDRDGAHRLAASGAISDVALDYHEIATFVLEFLKKQYPDLIKKRYKVSLPISPDATGLLEIIGKKRGCLKKGGVIDYQKASEIVVRELRSGKIGKISFETPGDFLKKTNEVEQK